MSTTQVAEAVIAEAGTSRLRHLGPELRLLAERRTVIYGTGAGPGGVGYLVYRWTWPNGWSPAPDRWFHSPEAALEPWQ